MFRSTMAYACFVLLAINEVETSSSIHFKLDVKLQGMLELNLYKTLAIAMPTQEWQYMACIPQRSVKSSHENFSFDL